MASTTTTDEQTRPVSAETTASPSLGYWLLIAVILLTVGAFYLWTAGTSDGFHFGAHNPDVYNELATALLHGHTYLPLKVPAGLLALRDPYDPAQNAAYQAGYHDLALRHDHFYSTWGPSPVLLFMLFRLTPVDMSQSFAVFLYGFFGLICAVVLQHVLARRFVPDVSWWLLAIATVGLALSNVLPFLLRRPAQYEVAIAGGYFFEMAGMLLVVTAILGGRARFTRLALGSLCLGLAVIARPTLIVGGAVAVAALVLLVRSGQRRGRTALATLAPLVICGALLIGYNEARFGGASDFGQRYQLAGLNVTHKPTNQPSYVPPGVFSYLLIPPRLTLTFPHVFLMTTAQYPFRLPAGYADTPGGGQAEPAGGLLTTIPITLLLLTLPFLWRRRRPGDQAALRVIGALTAMTLAVIALLSAALWGTTERYEVDYATYGLLAAFLLWAFLVGRLRARRGAHRAVIVVGVLLTFLGALAGTAISFTGYRNQLDVNHPATFNGLEDVTAPLVTLLTKLTGRPELVRVASPLPASYLQGYGDFSENHAAFYVGGTAVTVVIVSPRSENAGLLADVGAVPGAPAPSAQVIRVRSSSRPVGTIPIVSSYIRLPIHLHGGLNRIALSVQGALPRQMERLVLGNLRIGP